MRSSCGVGVWMAGLKMRLSRDTDSSDLRGGLSRSDALRLSAFGLALFAGLLLILTFQFFPSRYSLNEGDVSGVNVRSPQKVTFVSQSKTDEERVRAAGAVPDVYVHDQSIATQQRQKLNETIQRIDEVRAQSKTFTEKRDAISRLPNISLSGSVLTDVVTWSDADWRSVAAESQRVLDLLLRRKIGVSDLKDMADTLPTLVSSQLARGQSAAVVELAQAYVQPNFLLDSAATEKARQEARDAVSPIRITLEKGEMIMREGEVVRASNLEQLEAAGLRNPAVDWQSVVGSALLVGVLVAALCMYLLFCRPVVMADSRRLLLVLLVLLIAVLAAKLVVPGREIYGYLFPVAAVALLVGTLLDAEMALVPAMVVAVVVGFMSNASLEFTTLGVVGGIVGALGARRIERLNSFFITGVAIAAANLCVVFSFELTSGALDPPRLALLAFVVIVNGALCAALSLGTFSVLGHVFGITTTLSLLELAHPTQRLFRRLLTEAPGTYHHSVVVASLSERAAQLVGADALLARVGAYYHDIGKVNHPYFFIENQLDGNNVHDLLDPERSVKAIAAHVSDGVEMAHKQGLPGKVIDIIAQHHGTTLVRYFYHQAVQDRGEGVSPEKFSYPGPKPQTREAGLVMLADSVEAIVRSSPSKDLTEIERLVTKAVAERLAEGQLDECDLTMREMETIKRAFVKALQGIYHPRISYPEDLKAPGKKTTPTS